MQNEPDYDAAWDSCRFDPTENENVAGFNTAFAAFAAKIAALPNPPKLIVPDTAGFVQLADYIDALFDRSPVYGYDHHLYNGGGGVDNPDSYIPAMTNFAAAYGDKPRLQTEFSKGGDGDVSAFTDAMNLAMIMHNALVYEQAASYVYWELFWPQPKGLITFPSEYSFIINPVYYAFKHYSAFTDPNWQRIDALINSTSPRISAYTNPDSNQMSIVIVNPTNFFLTVDFNSLGDFNNATGSIYRTTETQNCELIGPFIKGVLLFLPEYSITTIALTGTAPARPSCSAPPAGDLTGDCQVDWFDFKQMADSYTGSTDDWLILQDIAETWLTCGLTNPADCWQ